MTLLFNKLKTDGGYRNSKALFRIRYSKDRDILYFYLNKKAANNCGFLVGDTIALSFTENYSHCKVEKSQNSDARSINIVYRGKSTEKYMVQFRHPQLPHAFLSAESVNEIQFNENLKQAIFELDVTYQSQE